jgi:hypothetical protein
MREIAGSIVSLTERLSMLNPRPLNMPAMRDNTPNSFSTKIDIVYLKTSTPRRPPKRTTALCPGIGQN